ncbi:MAG: hypothetical protein JWQ01_2690 [Massilia sp.]|nr:hypothetical protein [Massilia sp.]
MAISKARPTGLPKTALLRGAWRWYVALFTALSFFLLVATAESHLHNNAAAAHDCVVCSVVLDKLADTPTPPTLVHPVEMSPYRVDVFEAFEVAYSSPQLLPPSCGPPYASV